MNQSKVETCTCKRCVARKELMVGEVIEGSLPNALICLSDKSLVAHRCRFWAIRDDGALELSGEHHVTMLVAPGQWLHVMFDQPEEA